MATVSDADIVSALKENLESGFRLLMARYREPVYWHIRRLVVSHDDAQDAAQETFIRAFRSLGRFKGECSLGAWIYRIATNEALNYLRKKKFRAMVSFEDIRSEMEKRIDSDPYFNGDAIQKQLHKAILKLPAKQRLVFTLRYFDEMKYEDISRIAGSSPGSLKASYHHAYNKIREELEKIF